MTITTVLFLQALKIELKNERSSLEKKIQVSSSFVPVPLTPDSVCWALCYPFIGTGELDSKGSRAGPLLNSLLYGMTGRPLLFLKQFSVKLIYTLIKY